MGPGYTGYYLDPTDAKEFGPANQYLKHNLPEVKKLAAAAAQADATVDYFFPDGLLPNAKDYRLFPGMFREAGFDVKEHALPVNQWVTEYLNGYNARSYPHTTKGFSGVNYVLERAYATIDSYVFGIMHKDSAFFHGLSPDGRSPQAGDPLLNGMIHNGPGSPLATTDLRCIPAAVVARECYQPAPG